MMDMFYIATGAAICLRLLLYRRRTSTHFKRSLSFIAWLLIVGSGSLVLALLTGKTSGQQLPILLGPFMALLCALVFFTGGNISNMIRMKLCLPLQALRHSAKATAPRKSSSYSSDC
ncbi:MAG: phage holin family protein [Marinobacterium sp.]|nr:phage holin family protein [Marinobacterium sp.]